ncbi:MAG TPA: S9 family peptidase [Rudaea sp.]|nr:S9 family peptidase [Rudaea sp.]
MRLLPIVLCTLFVTSAIAAPMPLADFARHPQYEQVKISPEGDYLAATAVVRGRTVLALIHLANMKGVNVTPRDRADVVDFWWVASKRVMYTLGERVGGLEEPQSTGELYAVNADGSDGKILFGFRAGEDHGATHIQHAESDFAIGTLIAPLNGDERHALIESYPLNDPGLTGPGGNNALGAYPKAYKIDLYSGVKTQEAVSPLRNARFLADHAGQVRFAYGEDVDQMQKVYFRSGNGAEWQKVFDEASGGERVSPLMFGRGDKTVYFGCGGVCRWNVSTHKLTTLWQAAGVMPTGLEYTLDGLDVFAVRSEPGRPAVTLLNKTAPEAKLLVTLMQQFPGEEVRFTSSTRDGGKAVVFVQGDTDPGAYYLYDAAAKKLTFLLARRPWIKPERMASMQPVDMKARDGIELHGYLTRPPGMDKAQKLPLVVYVHGGPYGVRDLWQFDPTVQALASRGYAVLQANFRGSGGYGNAFQRAGLRQWGGKMQDDVTDATHWAVDQGIADPARICIFGGSYGGYAALEGAVKEPDLYRCAIGYAGVYDLRLMYTRGDIPQSEYGENYLKIALGEDQGELWDRSPIAHLDRLKAKVMLVVGGADRRVPPVQGENLRAGLAKRHTPVDWLYERTEGHGFYDEGNRAELLQRVVAFLDAQIGTKH